MQSWWIRCYGLWTLRNIMFWSIYVALNEYDSNIFLSIYIHFTLRMIIAISRMISFQFIWNFISYYFHSIGCYLGICKWFKTKIWKIEVERIDWKIQVEIIQRRINGFFWRQSIVQFDFNHPIKWLLFEFWYLSIDKYSLCRNTVQEKEGLILKLKHLPSPISFSASSCFFYFFSLLSFMFFIILRPKRTHTSACCTFAMSILIPIAL